MAPAERPRFQEMLPFCKQHRQEVGYVIVQNLSRFARNHADQSRFLADLYRAEIELLSAHEPQGTGRRQENWPAISSEHSISIIPMTCRPG
jgi:DNA invertase Pin-like site-specific DNA recombinase